MPTIAPKQERKEFELVKQGTQVGILYAITHLGTQQTTFKNQDGTFKNAYKIRLSFELPNLKKIFKEGEPEKPMVISNKFTLSMFEKSKLRPIVEGILGISLKDEEADRFDLESLLGKPCLVNIKHEEMTDGKSYALVAGTSPLMEGMATPQQTNPNKVINLFEKWDEEIYKGLPEFIRKDIDASLERDRKPSKVQDEVNNFDAKTIEYPDGDNPQDIPFKSSNRLK